jgi:hypothetical protein
MKTLESPVLNFSVAVTVTGAIGVIDGIERDFRRELNIQRSCFLRVVTSRRNVAYVTVRVLYVPPVTNASGNHR